MVQDEYIDEHFLHIVLIMVLFSLITGYSCATVYKDTLDLGNSDSGRDIYPCVHFQGEVLYYFCTLLFLCIALFPVDAM